MSEPDLTAELDDAERGKLLGEMLASLPQVPITPDTITQPIIDDWYRRERRYRETIAALTAERDRLAQAIAQVRETRHG